MDVKNRTVVTTSKERQRGQKWGVGNTSGNSPLSSTERWLPFIITVTVVIVIITLMN